MDAFVRRTNFDDFDAFVPARPSGGQVVPMAGGPWRATLSMVGVGAIQLLRVEAPPQIRLGAIAQGEILMTSRAPPGAIVQRGHAFEAGDISLDGPGSEIECRFVQPVAWAGVQFEPGALTGLAEDWCPTPRQRGPHHILRVAVPDRDRMIAAVEAGVGEAVRAPDLLPHPAVAAALEDSVMGAVARALADPRQWIAQPRATAAHQRLARRAVELLEASPADAWTLSGLARRLGVAPRTLHGAFAAIFGCSPYRFVKRWRLLQVRRTLQAQGEAVLVKTAALDHGFWHLGHFSSAYRAMFGESPQETRHGATRARGGWQPDAAWSMRPDAEGSPRSEGRPPPT